MHRRPQDFLRTLYRIQQTPLKWVFAGVAFGVALALRLELDGSLPPGYPFLTFFPAIILTAFVGGIVPGALVGIASLLSSWYFFIPPARTFGVDGGVALALCFFSTIAIVDLIIIHFMFAWLRELDKERLISRTLATSRDLMFKEMQHRVSNNLQVVSSLLRLQRRLVTDKGAAQALDDSVARLNLVSKIHRQLHDPAGQDLPFGTFVTELCGDLLSASGSEGRIHCNVLADIEIQLDIEQAVPAGLIIAELVSNALEHAFSEGANGQISVILKRGRNQSIDVVIEDNGVGLPPSFDLAAATSLGLVIAKRFATQLGTALSLDNTGSGSRAAFKIAHRS